jgi:hypothetical protein
MGPLSRVGDIIVQMFYITRGELGSTQMTRSEVIYTDVYDLTGELSLEWRRGAFGHSVLYKVYCAQDYIFV